MKETICTKCYRVIKVWDENEPTVTCPHCGQVVKVEKEQVEE